MHEYALRDDYQKRMDAVADRFYKGANLTVLVCLTFIWAIFSADKTLMQYPLIIGGLTIICGFTVLAFLRSGAIPAIEAIRSAYEIDHRDRFPNIPSLRLTGLYS